MFIVQTTFPPFYNGLKRVLSVSNDTDESYLDLILNWTESIRTSSVYRFGHESHLES